MSHGEEADGLHFRSVKEKSEAEGKGKVTQQAVRWFTSRLAVATTEREREREWNTGGWSRVAGLKAGCATVCGHVKGLGFVERCLVFYERLKMHCSMSTWHHA